MNDIVIDGWRCQLDPDNPGVMLLSHRGRIARYRMSGHGHLLPCDENGVFVVAKIAKIAPPHIIDRLDDAWRRLCGLAKEY